MRIFFVSSSPLLMSLFLLFPTHSHKQDRCIAAPFFVAVVVCFLSVVGSGGDCSSDNCGEQWPLTRCSGRHCVRIF